MSEATRSRNVSERVPTLLDEPIKVLQRRDPVTVAPGTTLAACLNAIQRTGTGDSVLVADEAGRLIGVLTERDIVARLVGTDEDLEQPVEALMNATPPHAPLRLADPRCRRAHGDRPLSQRPDRR